MSRREVQLLKYAIADGDEGAKRRLFDIGLKLALRIAQNRAEIYGLDIEDTFSDACVGLMNAIEKIDPEDDRPFASFASFYVHNAIVRGQHVPNFLLYCPAHFSEKCLSVYQDLRVDGCLACDGRFTCRELNRNIQRTLGCTESTAGLVVSALSEPEVLDELLDNEPELTPAFSADDVYSVVLSDDLRSRVIDAIMKLKPREVEIIMDRYGFYGPEMTLEQIGQEIGVTRERIRQIEEKALRKLSKKAKKLKNYLYD